MSVNTMQFNTFRPDQKQTISQPSEKKEDKTSLKNCNCHDEGGLNNTPASAKSQAWVDVYQEVFKACAPMLMRGVMLMSAIAVYAAMTGGWVDIGDMFYAILIEWIPLPSCYTLGG